MKDADMRLTVLGARGSIPVSGKEYMRFGGSTSCYMIQAAGETVFLDAGTGLINAPMLPGSEPVILLSHLHLDHILGLGMYPRLSQAGTVTRLYLTADTAEDAEARIAGTFSPPYWPLPLTAYRGTLLAEPLPEVLRLSNVTVESMAGCHPGGCLVFRVSCGGKSIVYAGDCEPDLPFLAGLARFARGTDLLLFDAQYTEEQYAARRGFGHATAELGLRLMEYSGAGQLLLIHHDPHATDEELLHREQLLQRKNVRYAREGEEIDI